MVWISKLEFFYITHFVKQSFKYTNPQNGFKKRIGQGSTTSSQVVLLKCWRETKHSAFKMLKGNKI